MGEIFAAKYGTEIGVTKHGVRIDSVDPFFWDFRVIRTNRYILRLGFNRPLCEWHPGGDRPALLSDPFHALATILLGVPGKDFALRVCESCAKRQALSRRDLPAVPLLPTLNGGSPPSP